MQSSVTVRRHWALVEQSDLGIQPELCGCCWLDNLECSRRIALVELSQCRRLAECGRIAEEGVHGVDVGHFEAEEQLRLK